MTTSTQAQFPDKNTLARALFKEAIRHLDDARILHVGQRYPAAIASAMKAAELGVKTFIVLDGALGWWDKTFMTHSPITEIKPVPFFQHHIKTLESYVRTSGSQQRTLIGDVMEMEGLAPTRPGAKAFDIEREKNTEYPFLSYTVDPATQEGGFRLDGPSSYFTASDSHKYFNTAQDLLNAVMSKYTEVGQWQLTLPESL